LVIPGLGVLGLVAFEDCRAWLGHSMLGLFLAWSFHAWSLPGLVIPCLVVPGSVGLFFIEVQVVIVFFLATEKR
jgi:hypothetical protein